MEHPNHVAMETTNGSQLNLDALYKIAPSCFTEAKDEKGNVRRVVDFTKLRLLLGDDTVEDAPEVYDFTWVGKRAALQEAAAPIRKTLRPYKEESVDWDTTQNLYIEGDNLEVLKLLQNSYMGKVKMIYIDPPYNTGNDFVYHDDFHRTQQEEDEAAGVINEEGERMVKNTSSNGKFHSDWCSMIYSRLMIARSLLSEDGVIFISIDSREVTNLKKICDEVFNETNFIDIFNWAKTETPENLSKKSKQIIEYVLCYEKDKDTSKFRGIRKEAVSSNGLLNQPNAVGVLTFPQNTVKTSIPNGIIPAGMYGTDTYDVELLENTEVKDGLFIKPVKLKARFKWSQSYLEQELSNGTTIKIPTMKFSPSYEKKEYDPEVPANLINSKVEVDTNESASTYQLQLFPKKVFNYPKPHSLIQYLLQFKDNNEEEPFIVLDFFSGSATTADAAIRFNQALNNNHCRFILVQLQEDLEVALANAKNPSEKEIIQNAIDFLLEHNRPFNICELAKERIRRAGKKIKEENPLTTQDLDTGFRVFKCEDSNYKEVAFAPKEYTQDMLAGLLDNIKEDRNDLDLLFDCMLRWGVELSLPLSTTKVDGCIIHNVNEGDLVGCFEGAVTEKVIDAIAAMDPVRVVFRDSSFTEAANKMNLFELFKQKCSWTDEEVKKNVRVI